jgi:hypothetical protein
MTMPDQQASQDRPIAQGNRIMFFETENRSLSGENQGSFRIQIGCLASPRVYDEDNLAGEHNAKHCPSR